ncbi:MAG: divergent polysaccharide deacetylase family protein [Deltaproteobacteria bacterium]|nr:divergent polysaccharide deacetylase family protein [Deltaproteobacteria bacterium]
MKKKKQKRKNLPRGISFAIWLSVIFLLIATVPYLYFHCRSVTKKPSSGPGSSEETFYPSPPPREEGTWSGRRRVAVIIDDIGYELWPVQEIIAMKEPVTLSILPHCPYSTTAARKAHRAGREIILHLPMEPSLYPEKNPGDGALLLSMSESEIRRNIERDMQSVPYAIGVNNHMGSRFMENDEKLAIVFDELKKKGLFFIDSYTTNQTKGQYLATKIGLRFAGRDIFIDNNSDFADTVNIMKSLMEKKNDWHTLIFIGHPYKSTIDALKVALPLFRANGIEIVPVSELVS